MGPIPKFEKRLVSTSKEDGPVILTMEERLVLCTERVSPFDIYPAPLSKNPEDGDFFIRKRISKDAASDMRQLPGIIRFSLEAALSEEGPAAVENVDRKRAEAENRSNFDPTQKTQEGHELIFFWRRMLLADYLRLLEEIGQEDDGALTQGEEDGEGARVAVQGILLNRRLVKITRNLDATGKPNVFMARYRDRAGSIWGKGAAGLCKGTQDIVNAVARGIVNNTHFSSRPSYEVDVNRLDNPNAMDATYPGQIIKSKSSPGDSRPAVQKFEQSNNMAPMLMTREKFISSLHEQTGIYPNAYGSPEQTGPAETLGGLKILRQDQTRTIKRTLAGVSAAIAGVVRGYWLWDMLFDEDESIKGDVNVVARGPVQMFMSDEDVNQIMGMLDMIEKRPGVAEAAKEDAIAYLFGELVRHFRFAKSKLIKSEDELRREREARAAAEQTQAGQGVRETGGVEGASKVKPESESDRVNAQANFVRAQAAADKVKLDAERVAIERAKVLAQFTAARARLIARKQAEAAPAEIQGPAEEVPPASGGEGAAA